MASAYRSLVELAKLGNRNLRKARSDGFRMTEVESEILTLEEVAAYLKAGKRTVYRLAQKGEIPAFKLGGTWRFRRSELDRWIAESISKKKPEAE
ncbi:methylation-associated defense system helix-turn-helix domain-containing protein MAD1 [Pseudomonas aeruginosa]|uniref:methylation-associated defense system helix-turn-helix domain-containing protein MAD1 n=1 Tax=Pseudomonas TaxID=286 RepID=UPI003CF960D4